MEKLQIFEDIEESTLSNASKWLDSLPDNSEGIIELCSHGGLVFYGNAIYQKFLAAQKRGIKLICRIWGVAASSAADIALSCDRIEIAKTAAIMIHSAWNPDGSGGEGLSIANWAQLAVIRRRLPSYTEGDLKKDRWFKADEAYALGLVDFVFDDDIRSQSSKMAAKYVSKTGGIIMDEERREEVVEEKKEEVVEERQDRPSLEDLLEEMADRMAKLEERIAKLEESDMQAACGDDDRQNARLSAIQAKINAICAPCAPRIEIKQKQKEDDPKAELQQFKARCTNVEKYIREK